MAGSKAHSVFKVPSAVRRQILGSPKPATADDLLSPIVCKLGVLKTSSLGIEAKDFSKILTDLTQDISNLLVRLVDEHFLDPIATNVSPDVVKVSLSSFAEPIARVICSNLRQKGMSTLQSLQTYNLENALDTMDWDNSKEQIYSLLRAMIWGATKYRTS